MIQEIEKSSRQKRVGLRDIAAQCGVSVTTVSRFLRNDPTLKIKPGLGQRINAVADYLKYTPDLTASMLRSSRTMTVAIIGISDRTFKLGVNEDIVSGAVARLQDSGYRVILDLFHPADDDSIRPLWRVDGFLYLHYSGMDQLRNPMPRGGPFVSVNGICDGNCISVVPDDAGGMRQAVEHLRTLGHRRIAYISEEIVPGKDEKAYHRSVKIREAAFFGSAAKAGISPVVPETSFHGDAAGWISEAHSKLGATAVIAYDHKSGLPAMRAAIENGMRIPEDLSLVVFNDFPYMQYMNPPVTAVNLSLEQVGRTSAVELLRMIDDPTTVPASQKIIEVEEKLIARNSTCRLEGN